MIVVQEITFSSFFPQTDLLLNPDTLLKGYHKALWFYLNQALCITGFPGGSDCKESAYNAGDLGWEDALEKGLATHFSILAWKIPRTEEPGGLQSKGLQAVRFSWQKSNHIYRISNKIFNITLPFPHP